MKILIAAIMLFAVTACATGGAQQTLVVSGESLAALGRTYAAAAKVITADCNAAKSLTKKQCADFRAFGEKFKLAYPLAKDSWIVASQFEDSTLTANATASIAKLIADLAPFLALAGVK